ncbi:Metalloprotease TldD [subsurface metagenome]
MKERLLKAIKKSKADYTEIRFEIIEANALSYRGPEVENVSFNKFGGGIARACVNGGWGLSVFDSIESLEYQVEEAYKCAKLVGNEKTELSFIEPVDKTIHAELKNDFRGVSLDSKLKVIQDYNNILLKADTAIETSNIYYNEEFRTVYFASSTGTYFMEERPLLSLGFNAVARDGSLVQRSQDGVASSIDYNAVLGLENKVEETAKRAAKLLKARPCIGGKYTVILNQALAGVFVHEAFGHLSEADFLYENPKMRDLMHIGREMGAKELNIVDDGSLCNYIGTNSFDDEGTPTQKIYLIKNGVLKGHLHSLETAKKMNAKPTGNARAVKRTFPPIIRMTNTYIENGTKTLDELISSVDNGIYACDNIGGMTELEMFTFSAGYGKKIENGEIGELIRDVVLTGNVFETLHSINGFGNDFIISELPGGCGKNGQSPLPVTFGSPHLRIRDVVIGGR